MAKVEYKEDSKTARERQQITYKGIPIRLYSDFSAKTPQGRSGWYNIFKAMKGEIYNQRRYKNSNPLRNIFF